MPRILAIAPYPLRSADTRYRIGQFIAPLRNAGWDVTLRPFMDERFYAIYNRPGRTVEKLFRMAQGSLRRLADILSSGKYDLVWLHKEAFSFGPPLSERLLKQFCGRVVYDMDDAFWSHPPQLRQIGRALRDPDRIAKMIVLSDHILAGNADLRNYAFQFNSAVSLFPTVLDTDYYRVREEQDDGIVTIGWVGRWSSAPYLDQMIPVVERLHQKYPSLRLRLVGAGDVHFPETIPVDRVPWTLERELEDIRSFDIGIMPLPDDVYSRGKCGFKLLQYMALGIPGVASPVGVNAEIVADGVSGMLASTPDEWFDRLEALICDPSLRREMGLRGRAVVEERFALAPAVEKLVPIFNGVIAGDRNG